MMVTNNQLIIGFSENGEISCYDKKSKYKKPVLTLK